MFSGYFTSLLAITAAALTDWEQTGGQAISSHTWEQPEDACSCWQAERTAGDAAIHQLDKIKKAPLKDQLRRNEMNYTFHFSTNKDVTGLTVKSDLDSHRRDSEVVLTGAHWCHRVWKLGIRFVPPFFQKYREKDIPRRQRCRINF